MTDIWEQTDRVWDAMGFVNDRLDQRKFIAAAILAERERCAAYIERYPGMILERQEIAADIRNGVSLDAWGQRR